MIKFFRTIRKDLMEKNKTGKYLLYAIGEIVLVVIGILIALQLNIWNESKKTDLEAKAYIESFLEENNSNRANLTNALEFSELNKKDIDTLKQILLSGNYSDNRIKSQIASMMALANFSPSIITMENISASGKFDLIKDIELKKNIISTYNAYKATNMLESLVTDYVDKYVTPFFFDNIRFSDFSSINSDFIKDPVFENIVFGYDVLLNQQIIGYKKNLEKQNLLNKKLTTANNTYKK